MLRSILSDGRCGRQGLPIIVGKNDSSRRDPALSVSVPLEIG